MNKVFKPRPWLISTARFKAIDVIRRRARLDGHNLPHLMFYAAHTDAKDWGSNAAGSPVIAAPYWFFSSNDPSQMKGLPPILVFLVAVSDWSDGMPAGKHNDL